MPKAVAVVATFLASSLFHEWILTSEFVVVMFAFVFRNEDASVQ